MPISMDLFSNFFSPSFAPAVEHSVTCPQAFDLVLGSVPASHSDVRVSFVNQNLAVIPDAWKSGEISMLTPWALRVAASLRSYSIAVL